MFYYLEFNFIIHTFVCLSARKSLSTSDTTKYGKEGRKVPRKGHVPKREVMPDPIYGDVVVTKLINNIMLDGKKGIAQAIVYGAFEIVKEKLEKYLENNNLYEKFIFVSLKIFSNSLSLNKYKVVSFSFPI